MASGNRLSVSHHQDRSLPGNQTILSTHFGEAPLYFIPTLRERFFLLKRAGSRGQIGVSLLRCPAGVGHAFTTEAKSFRPPNNGRHSHGWQTISFPHR